MKNIYYPIVLFLGLMLVACNKKDSSPVENPIEPVSLRILSEQVKIRPQETQQIKFVINPDTTSITWRSSDSSVAIVSTDGKVSGVKMGSAVITAQADTAKASCMVVVTNMAGSTLELNSYMKSLDKNEGFQLTTTNSLNTEVEWTSDNTEIVTVDNTGKVTAIKPGVAIISASNGTDVEKATIAVNHKWSDYSLVWSDEFNGDALDEEVWSYEVGLAANKEEQFYTSREENIRVKDGCLEIELLKEEYGQGAATRQYTSGRINSKGKKSFKYGKMEASISFPAGGGTWPAFWMMGKDRSWPSCGEIDIIEHMGNKPNLASFALHTTAANGDKGNNWSVTKTFDYSIENAFHTYGIIWEEEEVSGKDRIIFTVDDVQYASETEKFDHLNDIAYWPFNQEFYFIINMAIGGKMGGSIDDNIFANPVIMKVDWVRVYQRQEIE